MILSYRPQDMVQDGRRSYIRREDGSLYRLSKKEMKRMAAQQAAQQQALEEEYEGIASQYNQTNLGAAEYGIKTGRIAPPPMFR